MKRDMDVVREILLALEDGRDTISHNHPVAGHDLEVVLYHVKVMAQGGLIRYAQLNDRLGYAVGTEVTWAGHDFLDSVRDPAIWKKVKAGATSAGGFSIELMKGFAKALIKEQFQKLTGMPLDI